MIKVIHKKENITNLISKLTWSGNLTTVARKVVFEVVVSPTDYYLPVVTIMNGDFIDLVNEDGKILYRGHVFSKSKNTNGTTMEVVTYDYTIYLAKNRSTFNFKNITPKQIVDQVAPMVGINLGEIANPNTKISRIFENETLYEIIQTAYTLASYENNKIYHINYIGSKLNIVEVGKASTEYRLSEDTNITNSQYSESIENIVNRVVLYDEKNNKVGVVENKSDIENYGVIQAVYKGKNHSRHGKSMLNTLERSASIEALGDTRCLTGNSIRIKETYTGLVGEFFIISDTHEFSNNQHKMQLELSFHKMMDERSSGSEEKKERG